MDFFDFFYKKFNKEIKQMVLLLLINYYFTPILFFYF